MDNFDFVPPPIQPLVSIGIPTYNRPEGLHRTLECITKQVYRNLEIIVSDNASPDNKTEAVVHEFIKADSRIKYFRQANNIGATLNFQFVLDNAQGKYFLWAADDDLCEPDFISTLVSCLEKNTDIVLAMSDVKVIAHDDSLIRTELLDSIRVNQVNSTDKRTRGLFFRYPTSNIFFCIYGLYRTDVIRKCSLNTRSWRNYLFSSEVPFLAQVAGKGKIASVSGLLKSYRSHPDSFYIKESPHVSFLDRIVRGSEIRLQLTHIIMTSENNWQTKCLFFANIIYSWFQSVINLMRILFSKSKRIKFLT